MIRVERGEDGVAVVTIDNPAARNAMTFAMWDALRDHARALDADANVRVVVFIGAGSAAFVSGTAITEFRNFGADDGIAYEQRMNAVMDALEAIRVPTIAAIAGACTGGGAAIAACCDLRLAGSNAKFGFPIARTLGNCLSVANYGRLVALIGPARVKDLIFTARLIDADEAKMFGLVGEIAPADELMGRAESLARTVASHAPLTLRATKEALARLRPPAETGEDLVVMCYRSADFQEGMEAFLAKRPPLWRGE